MKKDELKKGQKGQIGRVSKYSKAFKRMVVQRYVNGTESLAEVGALFGLERRVVWNWKKEINFELAPQITNPMTEEEQNTQHRLEKQLKLLREQLEHEQMKNFALETMIDLAKQHLNVDLRKNFGAKQPEE